jgi:regulator of nucleoside diphosphate kinase
MGNDMDSHARVLTELDFRRLTTLAQQRAGHDPCQRGRSSIDAVLDQARVVPSRSIGPDVVTMYSQVILQHLGGGRRTKLTLCYPSDAEPAQGFVSVLSPVGASLIGRPLGAVACWVCPDGEPRMAEVKAILFQPEATGDYVT